MGDMNGAGVVLGRPAMRGMASQQRRGVGTAEGKSEIAHLHLQRVAVSVRPGPDTAQEELA